MFYLIQKPGEGLQTIELGQFADPNKTDQENYNCAIVALAKMIRQEPTTKARIVQCLGSVPKQGSLFDFLA